MKINKLMQLEPIVHEILKNNPITRTDDQLLYIAYWHKMMPEISFLDFCKNYKKYKMSNMESVGRCRRKIQEKYPELKNIEVAEARLEETMEYMQYAING